MKEIETDDLSKACDLSAFDSNRKRRHEMLLSEVFSSIQSARELGNGYEFSLPGEDSWYLKLAEWVTLERICCSFLTFEQGFTVTGRVWFRVTGNDSAKQFLKTYVEPVVREKRVTIISGGSQSPR